MRNNASEIASINGCRRSLQPCVCAEPSLVLEQGAKRQGNLPVLIPLGVGRKRAGVSQDVAPVLDEFGLTVERMV
jgi:hypothetical protein